VYTEETKRKQLAKPGQVVCSTVAVAVLCPLVCDNESRVFECMDTVMMSIDYGGMEEDGGDV
jgi:hypothetical protein